MTTNNIDWEPAELFNDHGKAFALVMLNVPLENLTIVKQLAKSAEYCIAADGAANRIFEIYKNSNEFQNNVWKDFHLKAIIGDMDSMRLEIQGHFERLENAPEIVQRPSQESTDFTKAVVHVTENHPHLPIVVIGSLYGRVDQALSQLHHLFMFTPSGKLPLEHKIYLVTDTSINWVLESGLRHMIRTKSQKHRILNKHIGIVPFLGGSKITTKGLQWDVTNWDTQFGGDVSTSNRVHDESEDGIVHVETDKDVLFTIDMVKERDIMFHIHG